MPSVMRQSNIIGIKVFPSPIYCRQFRIIRIFDRNIVAGVVGLNTEVEVWMQRLAYLNGQVNIVRRQFTLLVRRDKDFDCHRNYFE